MKQSTTHLAMQFCLLCGRTLTDRKMHDTLEEQILKSIREEHPEWTNGSGVCEPCITHYRQLLRERATREEMVRAASRGRWPLFLVVAGAKVAELFRPHRQRN